jgi:innexin
MGHNYHWIGIDTIKRWWNSQDIQALERFPRITMCKFTIRTLGDNIQPFDVQCLLPINIYNEKVRTSTTNTCDTIDCCSS